MSDEPVIPNHLQANVDDPIKAPFSMTAERSYTPDQLTELAKRGGYVVNGERLRILHEVGASAEQMGALRTLKGGVFLSLDAMCLVISKAADLAVDPESKPKDRVEMGKLVGYLGNAISKTTSGAVKMDRDVAEVVMEDDRRRRQSFAPGQAVTRAPQAQTPPINV